MVFIKIKVKGYLKNITDNEITEFEEKAIKSKDKITYVNDSVKTIIRTCDNDIMLTREGSDFVNTFVFNKKNSRCNYFLKENNLDVDIDIITNIIDNNDKYIFIKYVVVDSECEYEYKIEMSDI